MKHLLFALLALAAAMAAPMARADDAEIVLLVGKGESRDKADAPWRSAAVKQKLVGGSFVRTGEMSQMGLLLKDKTQVRLNQLSILNIKSVNAVEPPPPTRLELNQGRAWSQLKSKTPDVASAKPPRLEVSMPAGTANIRGTDWELNVEADGTSTVTVLSGEIEFYNDHGRVSVMPNEQARAVPGKAPTKILLSNAAERIQWVTAWRPQPRRWVKDGAGGVEDVMRRIEEGDFPAAMPLLAKLRAAPPTALRASILLADLQILNGQIAETVELLGPHAGDPVAAALLARAHLVAGRFDEALKALDAAAARHPNHVEVLLARAERARLLGDEPGARAAYRKVIEIEPGNAEGWYGIGRIETEREFVTAARDALNHALKLQPDGAGYGGELATLETFANEFPAAEQAFKAALERTPEDYVALTGLGVLQLKRGETEAALESFLKAGLIEPRYARVWLFSAAAYYQLGDRVRAGEALAKASSLDAKDPLPYLMRSQVHFDALELGLAIEAAREAQARMPFVKSLNQVLTDQKGSANVGSAIAAFGMEEWAQGYAYDSYSPYWSGSHLFLSDRFTGTFNKNSELFMGFLSDPSVFGASNRFSSLVPVPGHYASVGAAVNREYFTETTVGVSANGYSTAWKPFSYYVGADYANGDSTINANDGDGRMRAHGSSLVTGVGLRPTHELGLFAFGNSVDYKGHFADRASGLTDDVFSYDSWRGDVGLNYKFTPTNQAWFKVGKGGEEVPLSGAFVSQDVADALNTAFATTIFGPNGRMDNYRTEVSQRDAQWRHTFDLNPSVQVSWGLEYGETVKPLAMTFNFTPVRILLNQENSVESKSVWVSSRFKVAPALEAQVDLHYQDTRSSYYTDQTLEVLGVPIALPVQSGNTRYEELNPRLGFKWTPAAGQTVRVAGQVWRKPASVSTLGPVDTMGIPLDDRIEREGGRLKRARLQHEIEFSRSTFFQWFADYKEVRNIENPGAGIVPDLELQQLEQLRNRRRVYGARQDYLEATPSFGAGRVKQVGVSANHLLSREATVVGRYVYADTENTTVAFSGLKVPYHPTHYASLALNWQPYARWVIGPMAAWRSVRYADEANTERLDSGVSVGLHAYWETADKRWSFAGIVDQLATDRKATLYRHPVVQLQGVYRF